MRLSTYSLSLVLSAVVSISAVAQSSDRVALVTDVSGTVEVAPRGGESFSKVSWGQPLFEGDRIRTTGNGSASLLFANSGVLKLAPNSTLTVTTEAVSSESMSGPVRELDGELIAAADLTLHRAGEGEIAALGGLRSGSTSNNLQPVYPVNTRYVEKRPVFRWTANGEFDSYRLVVRSADGEIWSGTTDDTEFTYPTDAPDLEPEITYYWHVEAETMLDRIDGPISTFIPVDDATRAEIVQGRERIEGMFKSSMGTSEYHYVLGSFLASKGLIGDAIYEFELIAERHPDSPAAHRILGTLYSDAGMKDEAIHSLKRAIELSEMK